MGELPPWAKTWVTRNAQHPQRIPGAWASDGVKRLSSIRAQRQTARPEAAQERIMGRRDDPAATDARTPAKPDHRTPTERQTPRGSPFVGPSGEPENTTHPVMARTENQNSPKESVSFTETSASEPSPELPLSTA